MQEEMDEDGRRAPRTDGRTDALNNQSGCPFRNWMLLATSKLQAAFPIRNDGDAERLFKKWYVIQDIQYEAL